VRFAYPNTIGSGAVTGESDERLSLFTANQIAHILPLLFHSKQLTIARQKHLQRLASRTNILDSFAYASC
jgi:hypothetical protein